MGMDNYGDDPYSKERRPIGLAGSSIIHEPQ
jgi:hypothetical protein